MKRWLIYFYCLVVAFVFMFWFGLNSPIHTFNSHCDINWYLTMGQGVTRGKVLYRDLFDHKGPLVYFVFASACLFPNPIFVVWLIEVLCVSLFLYYCYWIGCKFLSPYQSLAVVPLMMLLLSTNLCRGIEGSDVEEYCLPIFAYLLLCFLDFTMEQTAFTWKRGLALGISMGLLFWTKFTMLEYFVLPLLIWLVCNLARRQFKPLLSGMALMLAGVLLVTFAVLIYFIATNSCVDLYRVYFELNIGQYNGCGADESSAANNIWWNNFIHSFSIGVFYIIVLLWGLICFAIQYWKQKSGWLFLSVVIPTWLLVGFFCGYAYYYLPMFAYAVIGVIYVIKCVVHPLTVVGAQVTRREIKIVIMAATGLICLVLCLPFVTNLKEINRPRSEYAPLVVADILAEYNETALTPATLFCYRMADLGFYYAAGVTPNVRYYAESTFTETNFPAMFDSFKATIMEQKCDFVVVYRYRWEAETTFLATYYHPYTGDLDTSTIQYNGYEPGGYIPMQIVLLYRN